MEAISKIMELMDISGTSAYQLGKATGISTGLISQWKQRRQHPSLANLQKIADYFNVPMEKILPDDSNDVKQLSIEEYFNNQRIEVLNKFFSSEIADCAVKMDGLNSIGKDKVLDYINDLISTGKYAKGRAEK